MHYALISWVYPCQCYGLLLSGSGVEPRSGWGDSFSLAELGCLHHS